MRQVDYVILYARDLEASVAFYRDVLGFELKLSEHGYAEFVTEGGTKLGLFERSGLKSLIGRDADDGGPQGEVLFLVEDVDDWAARLKRAGVRVLSGPVDRAWGHRTLHLLDPSGFVVELAQEIGRSEDRGDP